MRFLRPRQSLLLAAFVAVSCPVSAQRTLDPLGPVVDCIGAGKFSVVEEARLPLSVSSRQVDTPEGRKPISLVDGYRVVLATSQGQPFVNLKVELSSTDAAAADRAAVEEQMKALASRRGPNDRDLQRTVDGEVEVLSMHQSTLERPGPISFYSLFVPSKAMIATLYVLNQEPGKRAFATYAEYEALRDEAVKLVQDCAAKGPH